MRILSTTLCFLVIVTTIPLSYTEISYPRDYDSFIGNITSHDISLMYFFDDKNPCEYCNQIEKSFNEVVANLNAYETKFNATFYLARINVTDQKSFETRLSLGGNYPSIALFNNKYKISRVIPTNSADSKEKLIRTIEKMITHNWEEITTPEQLEHYYKHKISLVVCGNKNSNSESVFTDLLKYPNSYSDVHIAFTANSEVMKTLGCESDDILLLKNFDEKQVKFEGKYSQTAFDDFYKLYTPQIINTFNEDVVNQIQSAPKKSFFVLLYENNDESEKMSSNPDFLNVFRSFNKVAMNYRKKFNFFKSNTITSLAKNVKTLFDIQTLPAIIGFKSADKDTFLKAKLEGKLDEESINDFIQNFNNGTVEYIYLSEEIPEKEYNLTTNTYKAVSKTFERLVNEEVEKDVILFFHQDSNLSKIVEEKVFNRVASLLTKYKKLKFVSLNSETNEIPNSKFSLESAGFYLFRAGERNNEEPRHLEKNYSAKNLFEFIEVHGKYYLNSTLIVNFNKEDVIEYVEENEREKGARNANTKIQLYSIKDKQFTEREDF